MNNKNFETVKEHFEDTTWSIARVRRAVVKNWITPEQFKEITGEEYNI